MRIRTTGMFGSELVTSGTSLAAPQVTGAVALILEKDKNVSPDFVCRLLCESANTYGKTDTYGSGLLDIDYALKNYNSFKEQYNAGKIEKKDWINKKKIRVFEDTGCVEGCWSRDNHESLIEDGYTNVKKGARFSDGQPVYYKTGVNENNEPIYHFAGMDFNPWWHGYFRKVVKGNYLCNYVATYIYETQIANQLKFNEISDPPKGISSTIQNEIRNDVGRIDWQREYGYIPSNGTKRAFVWGMAIHNLADAFAHNTCENNSSTRIKHPNADKVRVCPQRWNHAAKAVDSAMDIYKKNRPTEGSYKQFSIVKKATDYDMINIKENISAVKNSTIGSEYSKVSVKKNEKDSN